MKTLQLKNLYDDFRDGKTIQAYAKIIAQDAKKLKKPINIMEVCGGHTHTIMKFGLPQLLPGTFIISPRVTKITSLCIAKT